MKTPVITSKDYIVYIEPYQGLSIIHCDCFRWSKEVKKSLKTDWDLFFSIHRNNIYAIHDIEDNKHLKFISMMGFEMNNSFVGTDGKERQLFVRKYNGN
jgi:hypothetical protein